MADIITAIKESFTLLCKFLIIREKIQLIDRLIAYIFLSADSGELSIGYIVVQSFVGVQYSPHLVYYNNN